MRRKSTGSVKIFYPNYDKDKLIEILKGKIDILKSKIPLELLFYSGLMQRIAIQHSLTSISS